MNIQYIDHIHIHTKYDLHYELFHVNYHLYNFFQIMVIKHLLNVIMDNYDYEKFQLNREYMKFIVLIKQIS